MFSNFSPGLAEKEHFETALFADNVFSSGIPSIFFFNRSLMIINMFPFVQLPAVIRLRPAGSGTVHSEYQWPL
ncbi:MAG: hypothetical protein E7055_09975 [Lentisphaerae bacterium]|nr:hypothetical protein [Lentisphaerota bacterium]